jgi:hypothetical protein
VVNPFSRLDIESLDGVEIVLEGRVEDLIGLLVSCG